MNQDFTLRQMGDVPQEYRGIGIRIEDDIVITETGNEKFNGYGC